MDVVFALCILHLAGARSAPLRVCANTAIAFPSGEGGPLAVDEENTVCTNTRLSHQHKAVPNKSYLLPKPNFTRKPLVYTK